MEGQNRLGCLGNGKGKYALLLKILRLTACSGTAQKHMGTSLSVYVMATMGILAGALFMVHRQEE